MQSYCVYVVHQAIVAVWLFGSHREIVWSQSLDCFRIELAVAIQICYEHDIRVAFALKSHARSF